ncbi:MAG: imidazoleglycerol-phosphate dehydratase HisB [Clostridia bacterium]|nr:imidazoleglycerol-phosphate dehydratase HisB [Clostridia bacterium]
MRTAEIKRKTKETDIVLTLSLDGSGKAEIDTGIGFLNHMLTLFAAHGLFDLSVRCKGDTEVDDHHSTEDIGIALGQAFAEALGDKKGIRRYADKTIPMDEALILSAVDVSGRGGFYGEIPCPAQKVGTFDTELAEDFWTAFADNAGITLHIRVLAGKNSHHILEGVFKSVSRSLREAVSIDCRNADAIPSTKGSL